MACLNFLHLASLTNDPIFHQAHWPPMPTNLPLEIPKFEGKAGECPQNHIMTFHLWCSSNSIVDDLIRFWLFQCTFTGTATKWYIELPQAKYLYFNSYSGTCSYCISSSLSNMVKECKSFYLATKTLWPTSLTTSMSGGDIVACARSSLMTGSSFTSY